MDQQETRLEHYFGDMYDKATLERIEADAAAERERRAAAEAKAAELNLRTPTRRELDAVISEILHESDIKKTTLTYGKDRGEGARFI